MYTHLRRAESVGKVAQLHHHFAGVQRSIHISALSGIEMAPTGGDDSEKDGLQPDVGGVVGRPVAHVAVYLQPATTLTNVSSKTYPNEPKCTFQYFPGSFQHFALWIVSPLVGFLAPFFDLGPNLRVQSEATSDAASQTSARSSARV